MLIQSHMDRPDMSCVRHTDSHKPPLTANRVAMCMGGRAYARYTPLRTQLNKRAWALHYLIGNSATYRQPYASPPTRRRSNACMGGRTYGRCMPLRTQVNTRTCGMGFLGRAYGCTVMWHTSAMAGKRAALCNRATDRLTGHAMGMQTGGGVCMCTCVQRPHRYPYVQRLGV